MRLPFPYDLVADGTGFMVLDDEGLDQLDLSSLPSSPDDETHEWSDLSLGFGLRTQVARNDRRSRFTSQADASIAGQTIFGPKLNTITPSTVDSTNGISGFFEIAGGLYAVNGRYIQKRTSDVDWNTGRQDLGSGKAALDHVVFYTNASGGANYAYLAMGDSEPIWRFDGTTYTQHASLTGRAFCVEGNNLWRSPSGNGLTKVDLDADPWEAKHWRSESLHTIGSKQTSITRLFLTADGTLLILKPDGIYGIVETGRSVPLFPGRTMVADSENGKYPYLSENWVYLTYGRQHERIDRNLTSQPIGPERYADNDSPVRGYITAGADTAYAVYAGLYNPDSGHSYLMKFGGYALAEDGLYRRFDAWHGSLSNVNLSSPTSETATFASDKITAMHVSSLGAASGHQRLYIGTLSGKIYWMTLPCSPNPASCDQYDYPTAAANGYVFYPYATFGRADLEHPIVEAICNGSYFDTDAYAHSLNLRTAGATGSYTAYPTDASTLANAVPGKRSDIGIATSQLDAVLRIHRASGASSHESPIVNSVKLRHGDHIPVAVHAKRVRIIAENNLRRRDGVRIPMTADRIKVLVRALAGQAAGVTCYLKDGSSGTFRFTNYREVQVTSRRHRKTQYALEVDMLSMDRVDGALTDTLA